MELFQLPSGEEIGATYDEGKEAVVTLFFIERLAKWDRKGTGV